MLNQILLSVFVLVFAVITFLSIAYKWPKYVTVIKKIIFYLICFTLLAFAWGLWVFAQGYLQHGQGVINVFFITGQICFVILYFADKFLSDIKIKLN